MTQPDSLGPAGFLVPSQEIPYRAGPVVATSSTRTTSPTRHRPRSSRATSARATTRSTAGRSTGSALVVAAASRATVSTLMRWGHAVWAPGRRGFESRRPDFLLYFTPSSGQRTKFATRLGRTRISPSSATR